MITSGLQATPSDPADMHVHLASGTAVVGTTAVTYAGGSITIATADASLPRWDVLYLDADGTIDNIAGTPAANPVFPASDTGDDLPICAVFVPAGATAIGDHLIADHRTMGSGVGTFQGRVGPVSLSKADVTGTGLELADIGLTPTAHPADLTDSSGGTPASTIVAVRSDTGAHTAADANANFATVNAKVKAISDALVTAGLLT